MDNEKAKLVAEATRLAIRYLKSGDSVPVFPSDQSLAALDEFDTALPEGSADGQAILELLDRVGSPATVRSTGGRYFGFVTGNSEPIAEIIPQVQRYGGWVHVDGAFGLWAAASTRQRQHVAGAELADSWATDAHKWLNASYDSGIAICRRAGDMLQAMSVDAAYIPSSSERILMKMSLQMSQRARGIEAWAIIATKGRQGIANMVDRHCDLANHMAQKLVSAGAELLAPVGLNQMLFSFGTDETTDKVIAAVQRDGTCWVGGTTWKGRRAMRINICDTTTTIDDIDRATAAIANQIKVA